MLHTMLSDILQVLKNLEVIAKGSGIALSQKEEWLDSFDMIQKFHISRSTLHRLKKGGHLVPSKLGKKDVFLLSDVELALRK